MIQILQKGAKVLEETAKEIPLEEISSRKIRNIISRMKNVLKNTEDAVALAGPQIGESLRIFVVSKRIFEADKPDDSRARDLIFINPKIIKQSKEKQRLEEGCLSVRNIYGEVQRCKKVTIRAFDENGKLFSFGASGLLAQVFQHEIDHFNGILFTSKAKNIRKEPLTGNKKNPSVI